MSRVHVLKVLQPYFDDLDRGVKCFEVRFNDRGYRVGDHLILMEFAPPSAYTGDFAVREVVYILDDPRFCLPGYVVLGLGLAGGGVYV